MIETFIWYIHLRTTPLKARLELWQREYMTRLLLWYMATLCVRKQAILATIRFIKLEIWSIQGPYGYKHSPAQGRQSMTHKPRNASYKSHVHWHSIWRMCVRGTDSQAKQMPKMKHANRLVELAQDSSFTSAATLVALFLAPFSLPSNTISLEPICFLYL